MNNARRALPWITVMAVSWSVSAAADPWLAPGDEGIRADVVRLADAGLLRGPVTTWPLSWPDIARDVLTVDDSGLDNATADALSRIRRHAHGASASGFAGIGFRAAVSHEPNLLRGFADVPREVGEISVRGSWLYSHVAVNLQGSYAVDAVDGKDWRADGSHVGLNFGNYMLSAGFLERWWGPGWDGSLILSTNARPIPSIALERNYSDASESRWFSWFGPWRGSIAVGKMESRGVAMPETRFFAARLNFKPRPWLEVGLTRTAQWCGGGRPCDWETFKDMIVGNDNQVADGVISSDQPGNQMAGYDLRLRSPWRELPLVFYTQWIGEDEAGGLPSKFLGQFGLEAWGDSRLGGWRARAEYADTACNFTRESPEFGCAYRHPIYPQGYSYRGRMIGHAIDNDSRLYSVGIILTRPNGEVVSLTARQAQLNRAGLGNAISPMPADLNDVELHYSRALGAGKVIVGLGYQNGPTRPDSSSRARGFAVWQQGF